MTKLSLGFSHLSDGAVDFRAQEVIKGMTNNPFFPNANPYLAPLTASQSSFAASRVAASMGGFAAKSVKRTKRQEMVKLLMLQGQWAMAEAEGNEDALASTGYEIQKKPLPVTLEAPDTIVVVNGNVPGSLEVNVPASYGAKGYQFYIAETAPAENTAWKSEPGGAAKFTFTGLQPGKQYWLKVGIAGARKQMVFSPVASSFVL